MSDKDEDEAFELEMKAHPWGYGQHREYVVEQALVTLRMRGLNQEAAVLVREIEALKAEIHAIRMEKK